MYKKLMKQHGGSIPFHILGGVKETKTKRKSRTKKKKRRKQRPQYKVGTIIRQGNKLMRLDRSNKWIHVE